MTERLRVKARPPANRWVARADESGDLVAALPSRGKLRAGRGLQRWVAAMRIDYLISLAGTVAWLSACGIVGNVGGSDTGGVSGNGAGGSGGTAGTGGTGGNACDGVTCDNHGACYVDGQTTRCLCEPGYDAQGLQCVELPAWFSKQSYTNSQAEHTFAPGHSDTVHIAFDIIPDQAPTDGLIGYTALERDVLGSSSFNVIVRLAPEGRFDARHGDAYAFVNDIPYSQSNQYHVRLVVDVPGRVFDAWVTPPAGSETLLASSYAFRANADNNINNLGKLFLRSENGDDDFRVRNHYIGSIPPCPEGAVSSSCMCGGSEVDTGACCSGVWQAGPPCPVICGHGPITTPCECGGVEQTSGACCQGVWRAGSVCPVICAHGPITSLCVCGGVEHDTGACCQGTWVSESSCPLVCTHGEVTQTCLCGSTLAQPGSGHCCAGVLQAQTCPPGQVLAFPGAEGFGARVTGGRGGQVIRITNLNHGGSGSLLAAIQTPGPRIVVFEVSGVIPGDHTITQPDLTIAGQTAPGAGITIAGSLYTDYCDRDVKNIIIRHLRVRHVCSSSDNTQCDAVQFSCASEFIFDHVSVSWGIDENMDLYSGAHTFTLQDSAFENPCLGPPGSEFGGYHNYGVLNGPNGGRGSIIRTAFLNSKARNPALADGPYEVINNLVYSYRLGLIHNNPASGTYNIVGNYYRKGPQFSTPGGSAPIAKPFYFDDENTGVRPTYYFHDNTLDDFEDPLGAFHDPWTTSHPLLGASEILAPVSQRATSLHDYTGIAAYVAPAIMASAATMNWVVQHAGAFPRDIVSLDSLSDVSVMEGQFGCPNKSEDLMTGLSPGSPPTDDDHDGMADAWESANGLNPSDGSDHATIMSSGYTAVEEYINGLAQALVP